MFVKQETYFVWQMTSYFDCAATAPIDLDARTALLRFTDLEYGNAGSRTHEFGVQAKRAVQSARAQIAELAGARADEVIFTSGATEANNLAILGLRAHGERTGRRHIVTTAIEHKAVLEPVQALVAAGFEATIVAPSTDGRVSADDVLTAVRPDTLLVSVMHANNETGALQPIEAITSGLVGTNALFHVDAAQSFGKLRGPLTDPKIHMISVSGHKLYAPKGVGALIVRRGETKVPLAPLTYGGGQERGLRPGTLPVALVAAFGAACAAASRDADARVARCSEIRQHLLHAFEPLGAMINGSSDNGLASTLNISFPGLDSEAVILVLKDLVALSNGSACTSASYDPSHVLVAMGLSDDRIDGALRFSWCHMTEEPNWEVVAARIRSLS
nr:aminotransferase class V-fold PLP-dependent enzyme [Sphingobium sp. AS12]